MTPTCSADLQNDPATIPLEGREKRPGPQHRHTGSSPGWCPTRAIDRMEYVPTTRRRKHRPFANYLVFWGRYPQLFPRFHSPYRVCRNGSWRRSRPGRAKIPKRRSFLRLCETSRITVARYDRKMFRYRELERCRLMKVEGKKVTVTGFPTTKVLRPAIVSSVSWDPHRPPLGLCSYFSFECCRP